MTDIEQKALALLNEVRDERGFRLNVEMQREDMAQEALCRAIQQHEAFRQEVRDAVVKATHTMAAGKLVEASGILAAFIIAKPDPLVEVLRDMGYSKNADVADDFRAAIEKRGGKIVWGEGK